MLEQIKAVTLPRPIWAAAARSASCRAGQRQHERGEEAGGGFFALRAPQTPKGAPPPSAQCPQPFAGFAFQEVGYDGGQRLGSDALAHRSKCSGRILCGAGCATSPQARQRTEVGKELVPNSHARRTHPSSKERCPCGCRNLKIAQCRALNCSEACDLISAQKPRIEKSWKEGQELVILHTSQGWSHGTLGSRWPLVLTAAAQRQSLTAPEEFMMDDTGFG